MICKICGAEMPVGTKFCSTCGNPMPAEENVVKSVDFDPDATIIADPAENFDPASRVIDDKPAAPVYQAAPAASVAPVFQDTPATPAAPVYTQPAYVPPVASAPIATPKKSVNVKMIAVIGGAIALIAGIIILIVCLAGGSGSNKKDKDSDSGESTSVASVIKEAVAGEYRSDYKFTNYKSEHKISVDGAYYQIYSANVSLEEETGYLLGHATVYNGEVCYFECEIFDSSEKEYFEEVKAELIEDAKSRKEDYKTDLEDVIEEYNYEYEENYDY